MTCAEQPVLVQMALQEGERETLGLDAPKALGILQEACMAATRGLALPENATVPVDSMSPKGQIVAGAVALLAQTADTWFKSRGKEFTEEWRCEMSIGRQLSADSETKQAILLFQAQMSKGEAVHHFHAWANLSTGACSASNIDDLIAGLQQNRDVENIRVLAQL